VPDVPPTPAPDAPPGRRFGDHAAVRSAVFDNTLAAAATIGGVENSRYRLDLSDLHYRGPESFSPTEEKHALLTGGTLARRLAGTMTLIDKGTGTVVDRKTGTVAHVPYLRDDGTFLLNGAATVLSHQLRLDPGVYVRKKGSTEVEAHVNVLPDDGHQHRVVMEPDTGVFRVHVGQAKVPALPLLRALGATDDEVRAAVGPQLFAANAKAARPHHLRELYGHLGPRGVVPADEEGVAAGLAQALGKVRFDPWVMKRTLGVASDRYDKGVALAAVRKVLEAAHGRADFDDRDSLVYQRLAGPEHTIAERVARGRMVLGGLLWRVTNAGSLKPVTAGALNPAVHAAFRTSGLAQSPEGSSALEYVDHGSRVTKVGQGGLGRTADAVPAEARNVSPSHFFFIDPVRTSESENVGLDLRTAFGTRLGPDRMIYAPVRDARTGGLVYKSPRDLADEAVAFPGWYDRGAAVVPAIVGGRLDFVPRAAVGYVAPSMEQAFAPLSNLVQMKSASKAHRASMGARMIGQSLPLILSEAPLVRTGVPGQRGRSFEELFGRHVGAVHAHEDRGTGTVRKVTPAAVTVEYPDGVVDHPLRDHQPLGRTTMIHNTPMVRPGDRVSPGQLLAKSNYTDEKGHAAYGANARIAFVPYLKGVKSTYEDSILVSQSFAKRLSSEHLYRHDHDPDEHTITGKEAYLAAFPGRHHVRTHENYTADGVAKPGTVLQPDQPVVMAVRRDPGEVGLLRSRRAGLKDASILWDHDTPGEVVDAVRHGGGYTVTVKTHKPLVDGDKVAGSHGNKGVAAVVPDHQMPRGQDGEPLDAIFSSLGITSRVNPAALIAAALGKAAASRGGTPYVVHDFDRIPHLAKYAQAELAKHGLSDRETIEDPMTGRKVPGVSVGNLYLMKLSHMAEKKAKGRGLGGYDESGTPVRGEGGASRMSLGDTQALLSHGAFDVLRDLKMYRGQDNPEFWASYLAGFQPTRPTLSRQFDRFLDYLRGAGLDPHRVDDSVQLRGLTQTRVRQLAGARTVRNGDTVDLVTGRPVPGGLFDPEIFGASDSPTSWAKIPLHTPYPSPVFEEPARRLLGLTEAQYREVVAGRRKLPDGSTGPEGLGAAFKKIDVPAEIEKSRRDLESTRKTTRDDAARRLRYLKGLERQGQTPADWMVAEAPVLPPSFRPVRQLAGSRGGTIVSDLNLLYRDLLTADQAVRHLHGKVSDTSEERLAVYDSLKAAYGLGDPIDPRHQAKQVRGVLREVFPGSSKRSMVVQKLLGTPANLSGRGQVMPDATYHMDQVGLPEAMAWDTFTPLVVRRLVRQGRDRATAVKEATARGDAARQALLDEMAERPVIMTRYPVLHEYNTIAQMPVLVPGHAIRVNPVVSKSMTMDHDGDTVTVHVPLHDKGVRDALDKMLPSRNLWSHDTMRPDVYLPNMEFVQGLYHASTARKDEPPRVFRTRGDMVAAYNRHEISSDTPVEILEDREK
jgi:DNA-directed RNA polymerase subunit beta